MLQRCGIGLMLCIVLGGCSAGKATVSNQTDIDSHYRLGMTYISGKDVVPDFAKAAQQLDIAAEPEKYQQQSLLADLTGQQPTALKSNVEAQRMLALLYFEGQGVDMDQAKAADLYHRAIASDDGASEASLAMQYEKGLGVPQDMVKAYALFHLAADQRDIDGKIGLQRLAGKMTTQERQKGEAMFRTLAQAINVPSSNPQLVASILGMPQQKKQPSTFLADLFGGDAASSSSRAVPKPFSLNDKLLCHLQGADVLQFLLFDQTQLEDCSKNPCTHSPISRQKQADGLSITKKDGTVQWHVAADGKLVILLSGTRTIAGDCSNAL